MDSYAWFRGLVQGAPASSTMPTLERVADGRVFTGRQAVALKLVDELGDEKTAVAWLAKEKNIDPKTPVRDYRLRDRLQRPAVPAYGGGRHARSGGPELVRAAHRGLGRGAGDGAPQP